MLSRPCRMGRRRKKRRGKRARRWRDEEEDEEECEEEDHSEPRMHQRCRNAPSRPMSPPHKSIRAFPFATGRAPLKGRRPYGPGIRERAPFCKEAAVHHC